MSKKIYPPGVKHLSFLSAISSIISLIILIILLPIHSLQGQTRTTGNQSLFSSPPRNLYSIQDHFYATWGHKDNTTINHDLDQDEEENEEDSYYNEFKRWEYLMQSRTYPSGNLPDPGILFQEYDRYQKSHPASTTRSATWSPVGNAVVPGNGGGVGRINVIRIDPTNTNTIYIGSAGGGVWKTTNGGTTWMDITTNIPVTSIADIAIDPTNPNNIYLATGDGYGYEATWQMDNDFWGGVYSAGVLKSIDGGNTWSPTGLSYAQSNNQIIQRLIIHPTNPAILLAATRNGIYRTADGGATWTLVDADHCYDMEFNTANPDIIYAGGNLNILRSVDAGATWSVLKSNLCSTGRISIETTAANSNVIYALCQSGSLFKSTDGGVTWTNKLSPSGYASFYGYYDLVLECSDANENYLLAGGLSVAKSTNGGTSWSTISSWSCSTCSNYVHADNHDLEFLPGSTQTIYSSNDGGIFKSTNLGTSWTDLSTGLRLAQAYRLSSSATNPSIVYSGWQDNGSNRWNGTSYTQVYGADGMETLIDYTNSNTVFIESQYGNIYRSTNGGSTFNFVAPSSGAWLTEYIMDPLDHNKMYAGYASLYKSTNNGSSWTSIGSNLYGGDYCTAIAVAPSNTNYIYTSSLGVMKKSTDGGSNWSTITTGLPVGSVGINYIAVSNLDPNSVWVALSGYSDGNKVFHSTDAGSTWINVSGTLPNLPVNTIVYENGSPNRVYIGTDIGVYYRDDNLSDWAFYNDGLPNVMVHELEINYTSGKLLAATYGRGIWQSDLAGNGSTNPSISTSSIGTSSLCDGQSIGVPFTITGTFNAGNIFTAQLSNSSGSFSSPVNIGMLSSTFSGTINCVIPVSTATGSAYRIRVVSSNPSLMGTDNGTNLSITACTAPTTPTTSSITSSSATLSWTPVACVNTYQVQYHSASSSTWLKINVTGSSYNLSGLTPSTTYKWKVRTQCATSPKIFSAFTAVKTFTTPAARFSVDNNTTNQLSVYPNPLSNVATLNCVLNASSQIELTLFDLQGKVIKEIFDGSLNEGSYQFVLNRDHITNGIYLLRMISGEETITQKVVIE